MQPFVFDADEDGPLSAVRRCVRPRYGENFMGVVLAVFAARYGTYRVPRGAFWFAYYHGWYGPGFGGEVVVPAGFRSIEDFAFRALYRCRIVLPASLERIDTDSFRFSRLESITIPADSNLRIIGPGAFAECGLTSITLPESLEHIGDGAFRRSSLLSLLSVGMPTGGALRTIGADAFRQCVDLEGTVVLPSTLKSMGDSAFRACSNLQEVRLPRSLETVPAHAFFSCTLLTTIVFSEGLTTIGAHAFETCVSLESIDLPRGLKKIDDSAFRLCRFLFTVTWEEGQEFEVHKEAFKFTPVEKLMQTADGVKLVGLEPDENRWKRDLALTAAAGATGVGATALLTMHGLKKAEKALELQRRGEKGADQKKNLWRPRS